MIAKRTEEDEDEDEDGMAVNATSGGREKDEESEYTWTDCSSSEDEEGAEEKAGKEECGDDGKGSENEEEALAANAHEDDSDIPTDAVSSSSSSSSSSHAHPPLPSHEQVHGVKEKEIETERASEHETSEVITNREKEKEEGEAVKNDDSRACLSSSINGVGEEACGADKKTFSNDVSNKSGDQKSGRVRKPTMSTADLQSCNRRPLLRMAKPQPSKRDLSWLEEAKDDCPMLDSMQVTLRKWADSAREWRQPDPTEGVRGKAPTSVFVGTRSTDPYPRIRDEIFSYRGERNFFGRPHGRGVATFENGDQFTGEFRHELREGPGTLKRAAGRAPGDILYLDGNYVHDRLEGRGKIEYR